MRRLVSEARHAVRVHLRHQAFSLTAVTTIAVAIAGCTLIFALVEGILLRRLGIPDPERLVRIEEVHETGPTNLTGATFEDLRTRSQTLHAVAAFRIGPATVSDGEHAVQATSASATPGYFPAIGVGPIRGRLFDGSDSVANAAPVVVISEALWQRVFDANPVAIGRTLLVNAERRQLVGVVNLPASAPGAADIWLPYPDDSPLLRNRRAHLFTVIARMPAGSSLSIVDAELDAAAADIRRSALDGPSLALRSSTVQERLVRPIRPMLIVMTCAVLVLLAVGFANVSNLILVQGSVRGRELSIRAALGAGRGHLVRQLMIESVVLATAGGTIGTLLGAWAVPIVRQLLPASLPRLTDVTVDAGVIAFGIALSIVSALAFSIVPAFRASIRDPVDALRSRESIGGSSLLRDGLVAAEVALTLMLLVAAGLVGRTLLSVSQVPLGFEPHGLVTMDISLPSARFDGANAHRQFYGAVLERLSALPGVSAAGVSGALPLAPTAATGMEAQDGVPNLDAIADVVPLTPGAIAALRIPLVRGRLFVERDRAGAAPVALVNASAGRAFWPAGVDPIGRSITMRDWGAPYRATVVGIVGDVHQAGPDAPVAPAVYYPFAQFPETTLTESIVVRTAQPIDGIIPAMRSIVRSIDRDQPIARSATMDQRLASAAAQRRVNLLLLGAFAAAALLMAAVGVYGVVASAMAARTREIGVRMALGATPRHIATLGTSRGAGPVVTGLAIGFAGALLEGRLVGTLLFGVQPHDPPTLLAAMMLLTAVAAAAVSGPLRRAMRIDPLDALRSE
jgi:putative ABC transport system permease protein